MSVKSEKELQKAEVTVVEKSKKVFVGYQELWWRVFNRFGPAIMLLAVVAGMSLAHPEFLTVPNLLTIGLQATVRAILAIGVLLVVISGGIDLSVGTSMSLSMVTMGMWVINSHGSLYIGVLIAIGTGILIGLVNGALVAFLQLPPFIVTLGMLGIAQGFALTFSNGFSMYGFPKEFGFVGGGEVLGIPVPIIILAIVGVLASYIVRETKLGRYAYAIGGSEEAARRAGIRVRGFKVAIYGFCGALVGIASIVLASRINSAHPGVGLGYELDAIAAVVIGGASLVGGRGNVSGAIIGALMMAAIRFGLNIMAVTPFIQQVVIGVILIIAVYLDRLRILQERKLDKLRAR
jgi:ribose/xylose/arabinose/galactoside ABC-type transport system permease subunit